MEQEEAVDNPGSKSDEHNEKQSKGSLQKKNKLCGNFPHLVYQIYVSEKL